MTFDMMTDPRIKAGGVISVASNIAPKAVAEMTALVNQGKTEEAKALCKALDPLFGIVTVKTEEQTPRGPVVCRARNPVAAKTLMNILGMPSGPCRPPLGRLTRKGMDVILEAGRSVLANDPAVLAPVAQFFDVDIEARLNDETLHKDLIYEEYEASL
jgi:4-hydroxy-tetrahydrodipicolinate synthase